jgi:hypothetical protein
MEGSNCSLIEVLSLKSLKKKPDVQNGYFLKLKPFMSQVQVRRDTTCVVTYKEIILNVYVYIYHDISDTRHTCYTFFPHEKLRVILNVQLLFPKTSIKKLDVSYFQSNVCGIVMLTLNLSTAVNFMSFRLCLHMKCIYALIVLV